MADYGQGILGHYRSGDSNPVDRSDAHAEGFRTGEGASRERSLTSFLMGIF